MDWASILYLGVTGGLVVLLVCIVGRTYNRKRRETIEAPKHRMLEDDD